MVKKLQNELVSFGNARASQIAMYFYRHLWKHFTQIQPVLSPEVNQ